MIAGYTARPARLQVGFTLIEVLVVILLIGIIASFAVMSIGDRSTADRLERDANRLKQVVQLASEEAQVKGIEIGLERTESGYRFLANTPAAAGWVPIEGGGPFGAQDFESPFEFELLAEGRVVPPPEPDAEADPVPAVLMLSSGEMTPFEIRLGARDLDHTWVVRGGPLGSVGMDRPGEQP